MSSKLLLFVVHQQIYQLILKIYFSYLALGLHCIWPDRLCPCHGDDPSPCRQQVWKTLKVWLKR